MPRYRTRSEKLLNTIRKLQAEGELSVNDLRRLLGSLSEARAVAALLVEIKLAESVAKTRAETKREAEHLRCVEDWTLDSKGMSLVNDYVMGRRESEKYSELRGLLEPHFRGITRTPEAARERREAAEHEARPAGVEAVDHVVVKTSKADSKTADKFVRDFLDVQDIVLKQESERKKKHSGDDI